MRHLCQGDSIERSEDRIQIPTETSDSNGLLSSICVELPENLRECSEDVSSSLQAPQLETETGPDSEVEIGLPLDDKYMLKGLIRNETHGSVYEVTNLTMPQTKLEEYSTSSTVLMQRGGNAAG